MRRRSECPCRPASKQAGQSADHGNHNQMKRRAVLAGLAERTLTTIRLAPARSCALFASPPHR